MKEQPKTTREGEEEDEEEEEEEKKKGELERLCSPTPSLFLLLWFQMRADSLSLASEGRAAFEGDRQTDRQADWMKLSSFIRD